MRLPGADGKQDGRQHTHCRQPEGGRDAHHRKQGGNQYAAHHVEKGAYTADSPEVQTELVAVAHQNIIGEVGHGAPEKVNQRNENEKQYRRNRQTCGNQGDQGIKSHTQGQYHDQDSFDGADFVADHTPEGNGRYGLYPA